MGLKKCKKIRRQFGKKIIRDEFNAMLKAEDEDRRHSEMDDFGENYMYYGDFMDYLYENSNDEDCFDEGDWFEDDEWFFSDDDDLCVGDD